MTQVLGIKILHHVPISGAGYACLHLVPGKDPSSIVDQQFENQVSQRVRQAHDRTRSDHSQVSFLLDDAAKLQLVVSKMYESLRDDYGRSGVVFGLRVDVKISNPNFDFISNFIEICDDFLDSMARSHSSFSAGIVSDLPMEGQRVSYEIALNECALSFFDIVQASVGGTHSVENALFDHSKYLGVSDEVRVVESVLSSNLFRLALLEAVERKVDERLREVAARPRWWSGR